MQMNMTTLRNGSRKLGTHLRQRQAEAQCGSLSLASVDRATNWAKCLRVCHDPSHRLSVDQSEASPRNSSLHAKYGRYMLRLAETEKHSLLRGLAHRGAPQLVSVSSVFPAEEIVDYRGPYQKQHWKTSNANGNEWISGTDKNEWTFGTDGNCGLLMQMEMIGLLMRMKMSDLRNGPRRYCRLLGSCTKNNTSWVQSVKNNTSSVQSVFKDDKCNAFSNVVYFLR